MSGPTIFLLVWALGAAYVIITIYVRGKKAISIFPDVNSVNVIYRERNGSGFSTQSDKTKRRGARNLLDIMVTEDELWFKTILLFAFIAERSDILHRISLNRITRVEKQGKNITVDFTTEFGQAKQVVIISKQPEELLKALSKVAHKITSS